MSLDLVSPLGLGVDFEPLGEGIVEEHAEDVAEDESARDGDDIFLPYQHYQEDQVAYRETEK